MADIFLSYSREDQATARRFAEGFERAGFSVWWDATLNPGEAYDKVTEKALEEARAVVVLWSRKSVDSRWVRAEATQANSNGTLVPVMIEPCKRPIMFELTHSADLAHWTGDPDDKAWQSCVTGVRRFVQKGGPHPITTPSTPQPGRPRQGRTAVIAAALLLVAGAGIWTFMHFHGDPGVRASDSQPGQGPAAANAVAPPEVTLAVLPFVNLSSDPEQEFFSDGLTEEILNRLAQLQALRVTGRTSSFSFKGRNEDLRVIGEKLGVANLLEGSIRKNGIQLRITAQLISSKDGAHLWSKTYARELKDVFAIQEEIAKDVATALSIKLDVGTMTRAQGGTTNLEAYEKFLRAQTLQRQWGPDVYEAVQLYREAVALDPMFWRAWFGLRSTLGAIRVVFPDRAVEANKDMSEVRAHLVEAAPDSWAKQAMLANYYFEQRKWAESEAAIKSAVAGMPASEVDGRILVGVLLAGFGRARESLVYMERAARLDPLTTSSSALLQAALQAVGQIADAHAEYLRSRSLAGSHEAPELLEIHRLLVAGEPKAIRDFVRTSTSLVALQSAPGKTLYDKLGSTPAERKAAVRQALEDPGNQKPTAMPWILGFADAYDDRDSTLIAMQRLMILNERTHPQLWQPYRTNPRTDVRFKEIVRSLGLVDYWRTTGNWGDFCKPVGTGDFECH
jgi:TolB-like protein